MRAAKHSLFSDIRCYQFLYILCFAFPPFLFFSRRDNQAEKESASPVLFDRVP